MNYNINKQVTVALTEFGATIINDYHNNFNIPCQYKPKQAIVNIPIKMELWQVMQIFGSHLFNGSKQVFVNNNLTFDNDDFT